MNKVAELHRKIAPELVAMVEERYNVLRQIQFSQPVGRRTLASALNVGERVIRAQVDFLKDAGLVDFSPLGMTITGEGREILGELAEYVRMLHGLTGLEEELAKQLGLKRLIIIRGDSEAESAVRRELGRTAAAVLGSVLQEDWTVAVSGGSTMAIVAESVHIHAPTVTVVPARGGLGEQMEYQANTIAAVMARKLGGRYRLLHIPDGVNEEALQVILSADANIRAVAHTIRSADALVYGIGQAEKMASRRGVDKETLGKILEQGAEGESLGQYCALNGKIVYETSSLGLKLEDLAGIKASIAVAGGRKKAQAIIAVARAGHQDVLIIDEAAARAIQSLI